MSKARIQKKKAKRAAEKAALRAQLEQQIRAELTQKMDLTVEQAEEVEKLLDKSHAVEDEIDARMDVQDEKDEAQLGPVIQPAKPTRVSPSAEAIEASKPKPAPKEDEGSAVNLDESGATLDKERQQATAGVSAKPASEVKAPYAARVSTKARGAFSSLGGFASRVFGLAPTLTAEEKQVRGEILKINNQLILTKKIIESNGKDLNELSKTDKSVADLLKTLKSGEFQKIEELQKNILAGKDVSKEQAKVLIENLENVTSKLDQSKVSLEAKFSDIAGHFETLITNDDLNRDDRREMIKELLKIGKSGDVQNQLGAEQKAALMQLQGLSDENLNFTEDQNKNLKKVLSQLSDQDLDKAKLRGTLQDLNKYMDSAILTNEDLKNKLSEKTESGKTLKESALAGGIKGIAKTGLAGTLDYLLGQFGLGGFGLGDIAAEGALPFLGKGVGKLGGLAARGAGGLLKGLGRYGGGLLAEGGGLLSGGLAGSIGMGGLLKGGARLAGKAALPLAVAMSAYDFYKGYTNAGDIAGLKPGEKATTGTKIQAGASSAISGLTFGLLDKKDVFKGITKGIDFLFGKDGLLGKTDNWLERIFKLTPMGLVYSLLQRITGGFGNIFGKDGLLGRLSTWLTETPGKLLKSLEDTLGTPSEWMEKLSKGFVALGDMIFGEDGLLSVKTAKKALRLGAKTFLPDFMVNKFFGEEEKESTTVPSGQVSPQSAQVSTRGADMAIEDTKKERAMREQQLAATQAGRNTTVIVPDNKPQKKTVDRSPGVDDMGLAMMNAGLSGI